MLGPALSKRPAFQARESMLGKVTGRQAHICYYSATTMMFLLKSYRNNDTSHLPDKDTESHMDSEMWSSFELFTLMAEAIPFITTIHGYVRASHNFLPHIK